MSDNFAVTFLSKKCASHFRTHRDPAKKINSFMKQKH